MADKDSNGAGAMAPPTGAIPGADQPRLNVLAQYVKDLSFENPDGPKAFLPGAAQPKINIGVNVTATRITNSDTEVSIKLDATAKEQDKTLFAAELVYSGVFRFTNIPDNQIEPIAMVECARLLFPFARQVLADATRNGGFPPLLVDPIDFAAMYRERARRGVPGGAGAAMPPPANLS